MKVLEKRNKNIIIGKMLRDAAFGIILMEIAGAITYIIDGIMTSRFLGDFALAASGIASVSYTILAIISGVISAGGQKICCSEIGNGKKEQANRTFSMVFFITLVVSIIIALLGIIFSGLLASLMGAGVKDATLHNNTSDYIRGFFIGAPGHIFVAVLIPLVQLNGSNKLIAASIVALTISDIAGDFLNVAVLGWGLFGMGFATSMSYYISAIVLLLSFISKNSLFKISFKKLCFDNLRQLIRIGMPRATKRIGNFLRPFFINRLILFAGAGVAMASFTVQQNIRYLAESVGVGIGGAVFLIVGIFLGEKDIDSLVATSKKALQYILIFVGGLAIIYFVLSPLLARLYLDTNSTSYSGAVTVLRCHAVSLPFLAFNEYYINLLQAEEKIRLTNVVTLMNKLVYIVIISFILVYPLGTIGLWISIPLSEILLTATIILANGIKNRSNPNRKSFFSMFDDVDIKQGSHVEFVINSKEEFGEMQNKVIDFCNKLGIDRKTAYMIQLFFEEVTMLIINHGFDHRKNYSINIRIYKDEDEIILRTKDNCKAFSAKEQDEMYRKIKENEYLGISMVTKLARKVDYINVMNINNFIITI